MWLLILGALAAAVGIWQFRQSFDHPVIELAHRIAGERYYRLEFRDEPIGSFTTRTRVGPRIVTLESKLRAEMPGADSLDVEERLEFSREPPFVLTLASRRASKGSDRDEVRISRIEDAYRAEVTYGNKTDTLDLPWSYALGEHLSLEGWLAHVRPKAGAEITTRTLDFNELMPKSTRYVAAEARADGAYLLRRASPLEDTVLDISPDLIPTALIVAGAFVLVRTDAETIPALHFRTRTNSAWARVALSGRIVDPHRVKRLVLATDWKTAEVLQSAAVTVHDEGSGPALVVDPSSTRPATLEELDAALGPSLDLPTATPEIERLVRRVPRERDMDDQVAALLRFVGNELAYDEFTRSTHLLAALKTGRGDCTEFADLFTTLARALGIPARGVEGLVYGEAGGPGFYLHAWSEVALDGQWIAVDPTSGQRRVDATHLPFADTKEGFLRAYAALPHLKLEVRSVHY